MARTAANRELPLASAGAPSGPPAAGLDLPTAFAWGAGPWAKPRALGEDLFPLQILEGWATPEACQALVQSLESSGFAPTGGAYPPGYRNNDRLVLDWPELAEAWWGALAPRLAELPGFGLQGWRPVGLNPRFRACRYAGGQAFAPHRDGAHQPEAGLRSWHTLQLYLDEGFAGGATPFLEGPQGPERFRVEAKAGRAILFDHRAWHAGEAVLAGVKHVLRTDLMWAREADSRGGEEPVLGTRTSAHRGYLWALARHGDQLWSAGRDGRLVAWRRQEGGWRQTQAMDLGLGSILALGSGPEGLALGTRSGRLLLAQDGAPAPWGEAGSAILALAWAPDAPCWAALAEGALMAWRPGSNSPVARIEAHEGWAWALTARPGGGLWSGGADGWLRAWGPQGQTEGAWDLGAPVTALALAPEGALWVGDGAGRLHRLGPDGAWRLCWREEAPLLAVAAGPGDTWACGGEVGALTWGQGAQVQGRQLGHDFVRAVVDCPGGGWAWGGYEGLLKWASGGGELRP